MNKIIFLILLFPTILYSQSENNQIINRKYYDLSFNKAHRVANWVSYTLDTSQLRKCTERTNSFKIDPLINGSATLADYKNSGYDRGHLLPAGDMKFEVEAMKDTFFFSNITPQPSRFNSGRWSSLESLVRAWTLKYGKLWIVTGPVLIGQMPKMGVQNDISIPSEFYKVLLRKTPEGYKGIGLVMQTSVPYPDLVSYALTINQVEDLTGLDFFYFLDDEYEEEIENELNYEDWDFKAKFSYLPCSGI